MCRQRGEENSGVNVGIESARQRRTSSERSSRVGASSGSVRRVLAIAKPPPAYEDDATSGIGASDFRKTTSMRFVSLVSLRSPAARVVKGA
jgi:hypothetical protein